MKFSWIIALFFMGIQPSVARDTFTYHPDAAQVAACFVPAQSCDIGIVEAVDAATSSVRVQAYGFTAPMIIKALVDAKKRGVDVALILDKTNLSKKFVGAKYTSATLAHGAGIPIWIDYHPTIAHNKIIILDDHLVIGGSYNYTWSAEQRNAENVTYIDSMAIAGLFRQNWESRKAVSEEYKEKLVAPALDEAE